LNLIAAIAAVITGASMAYCVLCIWVAVRFSDERRKAPGKAASLPPVSILKPLKGTDPEMHESFRSHCLQDYPEYEILFGVADMNDPAAVLVQKLQREFPAMAIRLVLCENSIGVNGKVSALAQLAKEAKHEIFLVNDSDIRVSSDYLQTTVAQLQEPNTGMVTCLYRGRAAGTMGSQLEALGISTDFVPGVLMARLVEGGLHFGLGSTLAFRREHLNAIGGFEAIADYLADDYELGKRIADRGLKVRLSTQVVETFLPPYSFSEFWTHQLRWASTIRVSRPGGYAGLLITYTLPWAILCVVFARGAPWSLILFVAAIALRSVAALVTSVSVLGDKQAASALWLLPHRDLLAPIAWVGGLLGRKIVWRGEQFRLEKGKLVRVR
jgi:ceramide glucosyltransferase